MSCYRDDIWDLRPYRLVGDSGSAQIYFTSIPESVRGDIKHLMFLLLFVVESGRASGLSVSTIMNYMKAMRPMGNFSAKQNLSIADIFSDEVNLSNLNSSHKCMTG